MKGEPSEASGAVEGNMELSDLDKAEMSVIAAFDSFNRKLSMRMDIELDSNPFGLIPQKVLLATTARSGSHLLCEKLNFYGLDAKEIMNPGRVTNISRVRRLRNFQEYIEYSVRQFTVDGVFGMKGSVNILSPLYSAGEFPDYSDEWRVVYLKRADTLKQAISHHMAKRSSSFKSTVPGRVVEDHEYDADKIAHYIERHRNADMRWESAFSVFDIRPYRVIYEDLALDPIGVAAKAAEFLELRGAPIVKTKKVEATLQKQANSLNSQWEARFRHERPELCAELDLSAEMLQAPRPLVA